MSVTLRDEEYDNLTAGVKAGIQALTDVERLRVLVNDLYSLVKEVTDEELFKLWKIDAGLFQEVDLEVGGMYWIRNKGESEWLLGYVEDFAPNGLLLKFIGTSSSILVRNMNGVEYEIRSVERPE